jgi:hypothetical protein
MAFEGVYFGIHILGYYPDFDTNWPVVMWNENIGPVEVNWPIDQVFTVYKYGSTAMQAAANTGFTSRIVCFGNARNIPTNTSKLLSARTVSLGYQVREAGVGGNAGNYFDFSTFNFGTLPYGESKGSDSPAYVRTRSAQARDISLGRNSRFDLFQQTWSTR